MEVYKMRSKDFRILTALLLCISLVFGAVPLAFAEEPVEEPEAVEDIFQVSKSKDAAYVEEGQEDLNPEQKQAEVTLSLPSGEYQNAIDIVFVMDSSSSTDLGTQFIESATNLFDSVVENNPTVDLKIGVILFTGSANDAIEYVSDGEYSGLTLYNDETKDLFKAPSEGAATVFNISEQFEKKDDFRDIFGRGSGPHVGLDLAQQWLEEDSEIADDHKYVVFFTDGKGYIWANEEHEPTTIYSQYYTNNKYALANGGKPGLSQTMGYNKTSYSVDVLDKSGKSNIFAFLKHDDGLYYYEDLYNSTDEELTGVTDWDQPCLYAHGDTWDLVPAGELEKHTVTNGAALFGAGGTYGNLNDYQYWYEFTATNEFKDYVFMEANPFQVIDNGDGTYTFDTENINPNYYQYHVDCLQKGIYKAGHLWTEMGESYNCAVVTYDSSTGGGLEMVGPFKEWLRNNSQYGASKADSSSVAALFTGIDNSIRYMVGRGIVTDEVTDEFDMVMDGYGEGVPFKVTLGGDEVTGAPGKVENSWDFGTQEDETPKYSVNWDETKKTITWNINVPIENANPVTLSYKLEWNGEGTLTENTDDGVWEALEVATNGTTELEYWKSTNTSETSDGTEEFDSPVVNYREVRVLYDGNGGTGEVADENNPYKPGKEITLLENGFEREGYVFKEWNLEEDGSGDGYDEEASYTLEKNTTFYAIWDRLYTVKYEWTGDIPESDDVELPEDTNEYEGLDAAKAAVDTDYPENKVVDLKDGYLYTFSGWDEGTVDEDAATVTFKGTWEKKKDEDQWYTVKYEWTNAPDGQELPVNENEYLTEEEARAAKDDTFTDATTAKDGSATYTFSGWDEGTLTGHVITFAGTWTKKGGTGTEGKKYKLTYVSNGGTTYADEWYVEDVVVSLTYVPKREGYTFTGWHADEDLKNKIEKIKMTSDKTVYAGWKQTDVPTDLNGDDHFAYIVGYPDGSVMPEAQIKRSEVATIFFRLLKDDIREQYLDTENSFNDVDDTKWYNTAISTLENLGIIDGYADGGFHPENPITRAEFTAMAARFDRRNAGVEADFSDISGHWASEEISKAAENGWVDGYSDGTFLPDAKIKRCEAMAIVNRVLGRLPQSKDDLLPNMVTWPDNMSESKWFYLHVQEATNSHDCEHRADGSEYWTVLTEVPDWERYER